MDVPNPPEGEQHAAVFVIFIEVSLASERSCYNTEKMNVTAAVSTSANVSNVCSLISVN